MQKYQPKSFWQRPEGVTGLIFLTALLAGGGFLLYTFLPPLAIMLESAIWLTVLIVALVGLIYILLDPKMRALVSFGYKNLMRWITGLFIKVDPIGTLKSYVKDLHNKLRNMNRQINKLRGQMHQMAEMIHKNKKEIEANLELAKQAKAEQNQSMMVLKSRKAGRLKDSNIRLDELYQKMEVLYRVLTKMYENSEILAEDIKDQVKLKEQERIAIQASHSAMRSAKSLLTGDKDKLAMFDQALEAVADDVGEKMGEMEQFMKMSSNFMDSIDLQNGVFEEEGLAMLEEWQQSSMSKLLPREEKDLLIQQANDDSEKLDLNEPIKRPERSTQGNQYDSFFD